MEKEGTQADWGGADIDDFEQRKEEWAEKFGEETRYYLAYTQGSSPEIVTEWEFTERLNSNGLGIIRKK